MLLSYAQPIRLPEAADFMLGGLKHLQIDVLDSCALRHGIEDQTTGSVSLSPQERLQVLPGQWRQRRLLAEEAGDG